MHIRVNNDLDIQQHSPFKTRLESLGGILHLFGDLNGIFENRRIYDVKTSLDKLIGSIENIDRFEKLMTNSIGSFNVLLKQKSTIRIYSSPRGPGFFFAKLGDELIIIDNEKEFYKQVKDNGLHEFEILHFLLNHYAFRSPFTTIFKNTFRVIGGQTLKLMKGLRVSQKFYLPYQEYCTEKRSLRDLSGGFKIRLEELTKNTFQFYKRKINYVQISGGIDSCVVLLAAKQCNLDVVALHAKKTPRLTEAVELLCKRIKVPLKYCNAYYHTDQAKWWKPYIENAKIFYKIGLGIMGIKNMYLLPEYTKENSLSIGGHTIGVLYQGHPSVFPTFGYLPFKRVIKDTMQHKPKRMLYTDMWRDLTARGAFSILKPIFKAAGYKIPQNHYEYLLTLALTNKFPISFNYILPRELKDLEGEYINYRSDVILKPLLEDGRYEELKKGKNSDTKSLGQITRLLRFATNAQSCSLNTMNYNLAAGFIHIDPPIQGPMIDFLHRLPITMREVFYPKGLEYDYFRDILNYDYYKGFMKDVGKLKSSQKRKFYSDRHIIGSQEFRKYFLPIIDPNKSVVIDMIENKKIKEYIYKRYDLIRKGEDTNLIHINQILNIEILLKDIY